MNRRGFFGLLGKLVAVGAAMSVAPAILEPVNRWVSRYVVALPDGSTFECVCEWMLAS